MKAEPGEKRALWGELLEKRSFPQGLFRLDFAWAGPSPRAGQFFLIKPERSGVFLGRPISAAFWKDGMVRFLILLRGRGTRELRDLAEGERVELTGPLGNAWEDFIAPLGGKPLALIGGGIGTAPLNALAGELGKIPFDFYAGFRTALNGPEEEEALLGQAARGARKMVIALEEDPGAAVDSPTAVGPFAASASGSSVAGGNRQVRRGRIPGFLDPAAYAGVCACGPEPMLKVVAAACGAAGTPCFVSLERRMACGVGACLGCAVETAGGNRRCCADGPIFPARELCFEP